MKDKVKKYVTTNKYFLLAIILAFLFPLNYFVFKGEADNPIEQAQEAAIEAVTGVRVDLSPQDK